MTIIFKELNIFSYGIKPEYVGGHGGDSIRPVFSYQLPLGGDMSYRVGRLVVYFNDYLQDSHLCFLGAFHYYTHLWRTCLLFTLLAQINRKWKTCRPSLNLSGDRPDLHLSTDRDWSGKIVYWWSDCSLSNRTQIKDHPIHLGSTWCRKVSAKPRWMQTMVIGRYRTTHATQVATHRKHDIRLGTAFDHMQKTVMSPEIRYRGGRFGADRLTRLSIIKPRRPWYMSVRASITTGTLLRSALVPDILEPRIRIH